jgi:hypothetical protein
MPTALGLGAQPSTMAALNLGFVFVIIGAVAGPWLVGAMLRRWGQRQALLYLSLVFVAVATLVALVSREQIQLPEAGPSLRWSNLLGDVRLWLFGAVILAYFAIENSLEVWPEPYLKDLQFDGRRLAAALLTFWTLFMLARLACGWLPHSARHYEFWVLLGTLVVLACTLGNLVGADGYSSGVFGVWLTGVCFGPLLPGLLALVIDLFPEMPASTLGFMLALSGVDTLVARPAMIGLARRCPARTVMRVPTVLALVMAGVLLFLTLTQ